MKSKDIIRKGARVNNLKNIDVTIPRNSLTVITGLSGSGKSSLAFDTIYAEGQRRYVESLSSYARQFMGRIAKPECDFIRGLPPAIAIEQKVNTRNSRSTVGTSTEIYDYLRLLFSRVGKTYSPKSGQLVKKHTAKDVVNTAHTYPIGTRIAIVAPIIIPDGRSLQEQLQILMKGGYSRLEQSGHFVSISDALAEQASDKTYRLLIDRMSVSDDKADEMRLLDSLETAFYEGRDCCHLLAWDSDGTVHEHEFSKRFEADGITFSEPSDLMFNFNNPIGACPTCEGFGRIVGIDENLVIPNKMLSVYEDAVMCWRGAVMGNWKQEFIHVAARHNFPIHRPYHRLSQQERDLLWHGNGSDWGGIDAFFEWIKSKSYSIQYRVMLARYRGKTECPTCHGSRLKPEAGYVKVGGKSLGELVTMSVKDLAQWFEE
ncbi:MAG: excinuclease ABC subunit A, partial [Muribaculaceae bacterium]|nr:excinuclease ABC subunit A [Muribaculaceae bacterium]